jgi:NAD(P)H-dependent FMN reductase
MTTKILAFSGSSRRGSWNKKLLALAIAGARDAGAAVTEIDLRDFALPLYDGDLEASSGAPAGALQLKAIFKAHHGLLIASPEYNGSYSPLLKNSLDWISRSIPGEAGTVPFQGKVAAILSASPGLLGGARGLMLLRLLLSTLGVMVLPGQFTVAQANAAFDEQGDLKERGAALRELGAVLARYPKP